MNFRVVSQAHSSQTYRMIRARTHGAPSDGPFYLKSAEKPAKVSSSGPNLWANVHGASTLVRIRYLKKGVLNAFSARPAFLYSGLQSRKLSAHSWTRTQPLVMKKMDRTGIEGAALCSI